MPNKHDNSKAVRRVPVGTRYAEDRAEMLDVVRVRRGKAHRSDIVALALDRLLVDEGLLDEAA